MVLYAKTIFFLGKSWFSIPKPSFSEEKDGFGQKNQLVPGEKMVLGRKTNSFLGKTKKTIILDLGRIVSQKQFFLVFLPKTIFFLGKSWFSTRKPFFPRKTWCFTPRPSFSQQRVCISFVVCARCELVLPIRFQCHAYCDSIPLSVLSTQ